MACDQNLDTSEIDKAEVVFSVAVKAGKQTPEILQPSKDPFHLIAPFVTSQWTPVLCFVSHLAAQRSHLNA